MYLKRSFLFVFVSLIISCNSSQKDSISSVEAAKDSVLHYYNQSLNTDLSLPEQKQAINRAFHFAKRGKKNALYGRVLYQKSSLHLASGQYDSLIMFNNQLYKYASLVNDVSMLAYHNYLQGYYFNEITSVPDSAFYYFNFSRGYFLEAKDSSWVGKTLLSMGTIQKDQNDFFGSKETLTEALPYLKTSNDKDIIARCLNLLATNHRKLLNYSDAIKYYSDAISASNSHIDGLIYQNNLAATFIDSQQYDKAIAILFQIVNDSVLLQYPGDHARVLDNLAYAQWLSGKEKSEKPFLDALKIRREANDKRGLIASYTHLGEYHSQDKPQKAKAYLDTVIKLSRTIKMPRAEVDALKFLMPLEPANVQIRDRRIFLQDSLYMQETKVKTQFAHFKYENQVMQEKSLRLEKENAEKALEVTRQRNQKIISFFGLALLLLTLGFGVYYLRQRTQRLAQENKTAKLEATLETEAEMSRRLHDDFGAGLNQAMLMVQSNADKPKILDRLEGLYGQSRNFSREINEVDIGPHFKEELLGMLQYRTPENAKLYHSGSGGIDWERVNPLAKKVLFKVLQELMINMGRHSKATLITIGFEDGSKIFKVDYMDDGVGASEQDLKTKNGLRNTEKRIQAIGGTITFDSGKGEGFKAHIEIPK